MNTQKQIYTLLNAILILFPDRYTPVAEYIKGLENDFVAIDYLKATIRINASSTRYIGKRLKSIEKKLHDKVNRYANGNVDDMQIEKGKRFAINSIKRLLGSARYIYICTDPSDYTIQISPNGLEYYKNLGLNVDVHNGYGIFI